MTILLVIFLLFVEPTVTEPNLVEPTATEPPIATPTPTPVVVIGTPHEGTPPPPPTETPTPSPTLTPTATRPIRVTPIVTPQQADPALVFISPLYGCPPLMSCEEEPRHD